MRSLAALSLLVLCRFSFCLADENSTEESDANSTTTTRTVSTSSTSSTATSTMVTSTSSSTYSGTSSSTTSHSLTITSTWSTTTSSTSSRTASTTSNFTTTTGTTTSSTNTTMTMTSTTSMTTTSTRTTSTVSSSSTSSTTSSSSTTTRVYKLYIEEAELFPTYLNVSFNHPARLADENDTWSCPDLWEDETVMTFGTESTCTLSDDRRSLQVMLGKLARVKVGDEVRMKYGILLVDDRIVVEPTELSAIAMTRAALVPLHAVLLAADAVQACSNVAISLAASTGFARRAPIIEWSLGNNTDEMLRAMLQPTLNDANAIMAQILEFPAQMFSDAISEVLDLEPEAGASEKFLELEVTGSISNWQSQGAEVSAQLTVLDVRTPLLQIVPASLKEFNISNFEEVEMEVDIFQQVRCVNYSSTAKDSLLMVQWEYLLLNDTICMEEVLRMDTSGSENMSNDSNGSNDSNDSNDSSTSSSWNDSNDSNDSNASNMSDSIMIARACVKAIWQPLENSSFRDENPRPGSLRLPAFSFQPGGSHQFRAVATFEGYDGRKPSVMFTVNVQERSRPVAIITGPSEVSATCPFNLSAHESYDASVPKDDPSRLEFSWSCFVGVLTGLNETELLDAEECNLSSSIDDWRQQPTLEMEGDVLEEGDYTFMVKVRTVRDVPNGTLAEPPGLPGPPGPQGPPPPHPPPPPQPTGEAWWVMRLGRRRLPLVVLRMPWEDGAEVSMMGPEGPAVAQVSGTATCPVPFDWRWHWVLTQQGRILAALKTTVQSLGASLEVSSHDFRGDLLHPRQSYRYALVATPSEQQGPSRGPLSELRSALVLEAAAFVANAPPSHGLLELEPLSGEGLSTAFKVNTFGWTDETEKLLSYSFVRFPFESSRISADGAGGISFQNGFQWAVPKIDWHNASSPIYFRKQGGLTLQTWDSSSRLADLLMAVGSYFIMVRARDLQGGEGTAAVLGPVVVEPVNGSNGMTVLEASYTARDAERIMNTVDALLASETVEWDASPTASLLDALEVATNILDPRPEALEKMTQILVSTVGGGGGAAGIVQNKAELDRAANILDNCLNLAVASPENGVGSVVAVAMLEALSTFNEGGRLGSLEPSEESTRFTEKMDRLASKVASAAHAQLAVGDSKFLSGAGVPGGVPNEPPSGVNLQLISSANSVLVDSGLDMPRLFMPPNLLQPIPGHPSPPSPPGTPSRRLQAACDVAITATYWLRSNPYTWASSSKGMNQYVTADTTVGVLEFETCGTPLAFNESIPERTLRFRRITLPARRAPPRGFEWDVACARWSPLEQAWVSGGVEVQRPVYWDDVEVACVVYAVPDGNGTAFTAFFVPVEISTTTTTVEWTYPTYTTFEIPPLPPVYVISCNSSLLPEPPLGSSWNCTKPGEGQECRAVCEGFPDQITSVTCLKGQSSLEWFVTNVCPIFTTTTLDMTIDRPSENAILGSVLVFVFIIIFCCSLGICALMAYGLYKFTMNEQSKSRVSSVPPQPLEEEEEEEEDGVDPAFMDWAKHWAENPTVQSAVLERKLKAKSQEPLALEAGEDAKATASSAFTKTVELEYHDYWKSELEGILFSNQIPLDAEGRLYWVVNSVREILQVKDLQSLHQVNFPLTLRMQESPPQVEKAEGFYFWQVEWGALKGPANATKKDDMEFDAPDEEKIDGIVPELSQRQQEHEDLMKKWKEQKADRLRQAADPAPAPGDKAKSPKTPGKSHGYPPALAPSPSLPTLDLGVQTALHRSAKAGQVHLSSDYGGALAQTAAQASIYVPELQDQLYKEQVGQSMEDDDDGWLEVQSPSGRIYYWNQFTYEEWDPPAEDLEPE